MKGLSTVWPVLYFKADWPARSYNFDLGVRLIKADETILEEITPEADMRDCWLSNQCGADNVRHNTSWFLAINHPEVKNHLPEEETGVSFVDEIERAILDSFLMCLQLVRSTAAVCPFGFRAEIGGDSIEEVDTRGDFYGIGSDEPSVYLPEPFTIDDLQLLTDLWTALVQLRNLPYWIELTNKEQFFATCDRQAGENASKEILDMVMSHPNYLEVSEEERRRQREQWEASLREPGDKGVWWREYYRDHFQRVFLEKREEAFSSRTRIGRALNIFFEGLHLSLLHSYLAMCLTLETLFTVEDAEITYQFATRLANITGCTFEQQKDIFERARKVYRERSNIVHGRRSIKSVKPDILKDAFLFARQSLQRILLDPTLLALYSDRITSDTTKDLDKAVQEIKEYFRDLDLR